jgi:hypothetical protein
MVIKMLRLVGGQVLIFVMCRQSITGYCRHEFGRRLNLIGRGPSQSLLGAETAAMAPALFGR